tara:strand:+ start:969 stop:1142 length:174 start_codon:yes stop_codon:yes gene_type:complete
MKSFKIIIICATMFISAYGAAFLLEGALKPPYLSYPACCVAGWFIGAWGCNVMNRLN